LQRECRLRRERREVRRRLRALGALAVALLHREEPVRRIVAGIEPLLAGATQRVEQHRRLRVRTPVRVRPDEQVPVLGVESGDRVARREGRAVASAHAKLLHQRVAHLVGRRLLARDVEDRVEARLEVPRNGILGAASDDGDESQERKDPGHGYAFLPPTLTYSTRVPEGKRGQ
jgi:hypothetical protein